MLRTIPQILSSIKPQMQVKHMNRFLFKQPNYLSCIQLSFSTQKGNTEKEDCKIFMFMKINNPTS